MRKQNTAAAKVADRQTDELPVVAKFDADKIFVEKMGWKLSSQAIALRKYIELEASSFLTITAPISVDIPNNKLIVGYFCEAHYGHNSCELPLHTVEQARAAVDELIRALCRDLIS